MIEMFMRFPGGKNKAVTLSYDDGVQTDRELIRIMKDNGLKGTFNINSGMYAPEGKVYPEGVYSRRMSRAEAVALYSDSKMEVAVHSLTHPFLEQLTSGACCYEIMADRKNLEDDFNTIVRGMAYPYGTYSDEVIQCLRQCDIAYARTVVSTHSFQIPTNWLAMPATCKHTDPMLGKLTDQFLNGEVKREPWLFFLWGHSYEFERDNNWNVIEEFAEKVGNREDVWYATNIEIYDYVQAYQQLQSSADGKRLHNPTAITLYYCVKNGKCGWHIHSIQPGQTKVLGE